MVGPVSRPLGCSIACPESQISHAVRMTISVNIPLDHLLIRIYSMLTLFRTISLAGALLLCSTAAYAQVARILPSESELNRVGLTMAWWGQAAG